MSSFVVPPSPQLLMEFPLFTSEAQIMPSYFTSMTVVDGTSYEVLSFIFIALQMQKNHANPTGLAWRNYVIY